MAIICLVSVPEIRTKHEMTGEEWIVKKLHSYLAVIKPKCGSLSHAIAHNHKTVKSFLIMKIKLWNGIYPLEMVPGMQP